MSDRFIFLDSLPPLLDEGSCKHTFPGGVFSFSGGLGILGGALQGAGYFGGIGGIDWVGNESYNQPKRFKKIFTGLDVRLVRVVSYQQGGGFSAINNPSDRPTKSAVVLFRGESLGPLNNISHGTHYPLNLTFPIESSQKRKGGTLHPSEEKDLPAQ